MILGIIIMEGLLIGAHSGIKTADKMFRFVHPPFKKIHPPRFLQFLSPYKEKTRCTVNICFWSHIFLYVYLVLANIGLLTLFLCNLAQEDIIALYCCVVSLAGACVGIGVPKWCMIINNEYLHKKYEQENPIQARKHKMQLNAPTKEKKTGDDSKT